MFFIVRLLLPQGLIFVVVFVVVAIFHVCV